MVPSNFADLCLAFRLMNAGSYFWFTMCACVCGQSVGSLGVAWQCPSGCLSFVDGLSCQVAVGHFTGHVAVAARLCPGVLVVGVDMALRIITLVCAHTVKPKTTSSLCILPWVLFFCLSPSV